MTHRPFWFLIALATTWSTWVWSAPDRDFADLACRIDFLDSRGTRTRYGSAYLAGEGRVFTARHLFDRCIEDDTRFIRLRCAHAEYLVTVAPAAVQQPEAKDDLILLKLPSVTPPPGVRIPQLVADWQASISLHDDFDTITIWGFGGKLRPDVRAFEGSIQQHSPKVDAGTRARLARYLSSRAVDLPKPLRRAIEKSLRLDHDLARAAYRDSLDLRLRSVPRATRVTLADYAVNERYIPLQFREMPVPGSSGGPVIATSFDGTAYFLGVQSAISFTNLGVGRLIYQIPDKGRVAELYKWRPHGKFGRPFTQIASHNEAKSVATLSFGECEIGLVGVGTSGLRERVEPAW